MLRRLQAEEIGEPDDADALALHFDLTVPFARYVVENAGHLAFPFRRYQIQKVWRGERPQDGRFREFIQADIDVVGDGELPYRYEVELAAGHGRGARRAADIGVPRCAVNNRKVAEGFYRGLGLTDVDGVLRSIDKLDKIGADKVAELLTPSWAPPTTRPQACLALAAIRAEDTSFVEQVRALGVTNDAPRRGPGRAGPVIRGRGAARPGRVVADLKIARGLDYYTGTVYETVLVGHEQLGSICSGGRYDTARLQRQRTTTRASACRSASPAWCSRLLAAGHRRPPPARCPAPCLSPWPTRTPGTRPGRRRRAALPGHPRRGRGQGREVRQADQVRGPARHPVRLVHRRGRRPHQVKDIRSGAQEPADPSVWSPAAQDLANMVGAPVPASA